MLVIKDLRVLNAFSRKYGLIFDKVFKYEIGDPYKTLKGFNTSQIFVYKNENYKLQYFDGCFMPYLIKEE